jgi:hypothetical protein
VVSTNAHRLIAASLKLVRNMVDRDREAVVAQRLDDGIDVA